MAGVVAWLDIQNCAKASPSSREIALDGGREDRLVAPSCVRCRHRMAILLDDRRTSWRSTSRADSPPLDAAMATVRHGKLAMASALGVDERRGRCGLRRVGTPGGAMAGACWCVAIPRGCCCYACRSVLLAGRSPRALQETLTAMGGDCCPARTFRFQPCRPSNYRMQRPPLRGAADTDR